MSEHDDPIEAGSVQVGQPVQLLLLSGEWLVGSVASVTDKDGELVDLIIDAIGFGPTPVHESELYVVLCPN